jgi:hypothetical protein
VEATARERKILLRHSKAARWMELSADVVGGCMDGEARGGNERAVGWIKDKRGGTNVGREESV